MNQDQRRTFWAFTIAFAIVCAIIEAGAAAAVYAEYNTVRETGGFLIWFPPLFIATAMALAVFYLKHRQLPWNIAFRFASAMRKIALS